MKIELLYFDGCPNHEALLPRLRELLDRAGIAEQPQLMRVESVEHAEREHFLGSPTLRIDGYDVDPGAADREDFGLKCRLYRSDSGIAGIPPDDWILKAVENARSSSPGTARGAVAMRRGASELDVLASRSWISRRTAGLTAAERALHRYTLQALASGTQVTQVRLAEWAADTGHDLEPAVAALEASDLAHRDPRTGAIAVAYPFSATPTAHRVRLSSGTEVFAMCALDALGVAFMTGAPTRVISADPESGERIEVSVEVAGESSWSPRAAVVTVGCADGEGPSAACMCPHTNFAASPRQGQALLEAVPDCPGAVLPMPAAIQLGRDLFGTLLTDNEQEAVGERTRARRRLR
jgi:hypothetical protein